MLNHTRKENQVNQLFILFVHYFQQLKRNPSIIDRKIENNFCGILLISLAAIKEKGCMIPK